MNANNINAALAADPFTTKGGAALAGRNATDAAAPTRENRSDGTAKGLGPLRGTHAAFSKEALSQAAGTPEESPKPAEGPNALSEEEEQEVQELKRRDREVRQHEQAHMAAAGAYARGGARFDYDRGPDGGQYATGGEVSIDVSAERTPEASVRKAQVVRRAALAPADPSPADRAVAAAASQLETKSRRAIAEEARKEAEEAREAIQPRALEGQATPVAEAGKPLAPKGPSGVIAKPQIPLTPGKPAGAIAEAISPADFDPSGGPATKTLDIQV